MKLEHGRVVGRRRLKCYMVMLGQVLMWLRSKEEVALKLLELTPWGNGEMVNICNNIYLQVSW